MDPIMLFHEDLTNLHGSAYSLHSKLSALPAYTSRKTTYFQKEVQISGDLLEILVSSLPVQESKFFEVCQYLCHLLFFQIMDKIMLFQIMDQPSFIFQHPAEILILMCVIFNCSPYFKVSPCHPSKSIGNEGGKLNGYSRHHFLIYLFLQYEDV